MRLLIMVFLLSFFLACRKEDPVIDIDPLIGKYLTCDSIRTIVNGNETVTIKGRGTGSDVVFDSAKVYTIFSTPQQNFFYGIKNPKIYYWKRGLSVHDGDYLKIKSKEGKKIVFEHKDIVTRRLDIYYHTAQ
ncbi:MAG: hypothetical protein JWQ40_2590 [Segetibacter sp.]|jgi:hypothetical protein|nr:hypothetical protein [Segetibacter sp.]